MNCIPTPLYGSVFPSPGTVRQCVGCSEPASARLALQGFPTACRGALPDVENFLRAIGIPANLTCEPSMAFLRGSLRIGSYAPHWLHATVSVNTRNPPHPTPPHPTPPRPAARHPPPQPPTHPPTHTPTYTYPLAPSPPLGPAGSSLNAASLRTTERVSTCLSCVLAGHQDGDHFNA